MIDEQNAELEKENMESFNFWDWLEVFQYIVNFWLVALPWSVIGFWCMVWNVFLNVDFNRDWAGGNVLLMGLTVYGWVQYAFSVLLVFEIDPWLRHAKFIRFISLMQAVLFDLFYILAAWKFF